MSSLLFWLFGLLLTHDFALLHPVMGLSGMEFYIKKTNADYLIHVFRFHDFAVRKLCGLPYQNTVSRLGLETSGLLVQDSSQSWTN